MKDTTWRRFMPFSNLDAKDSGILKMLNDDSRATTQAIADALGCLLYTSPSPRDQRGSRMPSSA